MYKLILNVVFLAVISSSLQINQLSAEDLDQIKRYPDNIHHFIFFNKQTLSDLENNHELFRIRESNIDDRFIRFYINDCKVNNLPQCNDVQTFPFILLYNRILIRYNGNQKDHQQIISWMKNRIQTNPVFISTQEELDNHLAVTPNVFCFCRAAKNIEEGAIFSSLSKSMPFVNFCILTEAQLYTNIGLKQNNFTLFLNSSTNRRQYEHPNKYENWQMFIKLNMFPTIQRGQSLTGQRFEQKQKKLQVYSLVCDFSFKCQAFWKKVSLLQKQLSFQTLGYDVRLAIQDQKQSFAFNLYFHFTFNLLQLPAIAHINLQSQGQTAGKLVRHVQYLKEQLSLGALDRIMTKIEKGQIQPLYFSANIPKNNGFYGKASEKFVQKLVASNIDKQIASSPNHYVLLVTALSVGCTPCQIFYKEYKQIASLLVEKDVTFGVLNVNENEVSIQKVTQLPQILLFKKDNKQNPIRMNVGHTFDHLMLFFKNNLGNQYSDPNQL